jgi:hypothetical protein
MAETSQRERMQMRMIGIYVVVILALIRFLVYPLHAALQEKKTLLGERVETYRLKGQVQERQRWDDAEKTVIDKGALLPLLYEKGTSHSHIQTDVLERLINVAEKKGLTVLNFEMLQPSAGKAISEVPVLIRLRGAPGSFIEILETIEKDEKALSVKSMEITRGDQDQLFSLTVSAFRLER